MTEIIKKAIEKVDSQAEKIDTVVAHRICEHIISKITTDENANKVLDKDKSLTSCLSKITANAKKQAKNGSAMVEDEEVYGWCDEYYGFEHKESGKLVDLFDMI